MKTNRAFTLIELLVVVLIIAILAAVALPQYQKAVLRSRYATLKSLVKAIVQAEEVYYLANGQYANRFNLLDTSVPQSLGCSSNQCHFGDVGCFIDLNPQNENVSCYIYKSDGAYLGYSQRLVHSANSNMRVCRAVSMDLNDLANKVCKQETGLSTASGTNGTLNTYWIYP